MAEGSRQKVSPVILFFLILSRCWDRKVRGLAHIRHPLVWVSLLRRCRCILSRASAGLCPGVVSSLDVAHSLIQLGICLFTLGRHKEIRGVREGERVREELSSHIRVDGTHGESTLEWSAVSPHFSCTLSPALYVPQPFLFYSSEIHLPLSLYPPLSLLFLSSSSLLSISTPSEHPILSPVSSPSV